MATTYAPRAYHLLKGVFAVYKPSGQPVKSLLNEVRTRLLQDINSMEQRPQKQMILFQPASSVIGGNVSLENKSGVLMDISKSGNVPVNVPDWFDHPLVQGPRYTTADFEFSTGHLLDVFASGVQVLGLHKSGEETIEKLKKLTLPRKYRVKGEFGLASLTFSGESKIVEKSTWDHITGEKIDRVLTLIQGSHRNVCIKSSGVDLSSQRAYLMASKGLLRPHELTDPIILDLKLVSVKLPEFVVDVTCINESCIFIRKLVHDVGLELKSTAICTQLRRLNDSVFTFDDPHTLLGFHLNCNSVADAMRHSKFLLGQNILKPRRHFKKIKLKLKSDAVQAHPELHSGHSDEKILGPGQRIDDGDNHDEEFANLSRSNTLNS